jgi:hypothetical protein
MHTAPRFMQGFTAHFGAAEEQLQRALCHLFGFLLGKSR